MMEEERARGRSEYGKRGRDEDSQSFETTKKPKPVSSGRRQRLGLDVVRTKPDNITEKTGGREQDRRVRLLANYFRVERPQKWMVFLYQVDFSPAIQSFDIRKRVFRQCGGLPSVHIFHGHMLFTLNKVPEELEHREIEYEDSNVNIDIKLTRTVEFTDLVFVQNLNIILRQSIQKLKLTQIGRNFYDMRDVRDFHDLPGLSMAPGYITSIRQHEQELLLCVDVATRFLRRETAYDVIKGAQRRQLDYQAESDKILIGATVMTNYSNKCYKISEIDWTQTPMSTFETKNGPISFIEYYKSHYQLSIKDVKQPLLRSRCMDRNRGPRRIGNNLAPEQDQICLIPELCNLTGLTEEMRNDRKQMQGIAQKSRAQPQDRVDRLRRFNSRITNTPEANAVLRDWNLRLDNELVTLQGRIISLGKMCTGHGNVRDLQPGQDDWSRDRNQFFSAVSLHNWVVLHSRETEREARSLVGKMMEAVRCYGIEMRQPQYQMFHQENAGEVAKTLHLANRFDPQIVMVILKYAKADVYAAIKKRCCFEDQRLSQVVTSRVAQMASRQMAVASKISIQMNVKLGATPWNIACPKSVMVVGFDIVKDSKDKRKAFGCFVACLNQEESKYYSCVMPIESSESVSDNVWLQMIAALKMYKQVNQQVPKKIIFYRDGVSDGQLEHIKHVEVESIVRAFKDYYSKDESGKPLEFAYIVVSKRVNTRIFEDQRGKYANPEPGTVVDNTITLPERYDFYLVSQRSRLGTASPTMYNVIYDSTNIRPDALQRFTYYQTGLYFNWTSTISVPAVCKYAQKLAFLCAQVLHRPPEAGALQHKLHFL